MKKTTTCSLLLAVASWWASGASANTIKGYVSQDGLDFIAEQVPSLVPTDLYPDDINKDFACATATQRDTHVELSVPDFALTIPQEGRLSMYIRLNVRGDGELFVDDAYACAGSMTCQDEIIISDARATIDFDISLTNGLPRASVSSVELDLSYDDIDINFAGCAAGDIAEWMIDFGKQYIWDFLLEKAEELAEQKLGPMVEEMLGGVGAFKGAIGSTDFTASLEDLFIKSGGVDLGADVDISSLSPVAECVAEYDTGDPGDMSGPEPDLSIDKGDIGLAVNFGVLNDALYHVWRRGLTCLTGDHLAALGIHLPTDHIMALMPGFPPGSTLDLELRLVRPPRIMAAAGTEDPAMTIALDGIEVKMIGHLPDGTDKVIDAALDVHATMAVGVDPETNAMVARPMAVEIKRMEVDQVYAAETGLDVTRVLEVLHGHMLPKMLDKMGEMPLTGSVFAAGDYAVILRSLGNNEAFLSVNADLFRIPKGDVGAPETSIVEYPYGPVSPKTSFIRVSGVDGMIPTELLRYNVWVNGVVKPATYVKRFTVGAVGESGVYTVEVGSVDLSGNADITPASVQVTVDGILPKVLVQGPRVVQQEGGGVLDLTWTMSDDMTDASLLKTRVEVYEVTDPTDALAIEHLRTIELPPGATAAQVEIEGDKLYRADVHVTDAVGNETVSAILLDATSPAGCGCRTGGGSGAGALLPVLFALLFAVRRRRA